MNQKLDENQQSRILQLIKERKKKEKNRPKGISEEDKKNRIKLWTTFYRRNINLYLAYRCGINLHPFQHIMIFLMSISEIFFAICSRGLAKTADVALFAVAKASLYPYSEIVITATTIEQARRMVQDKMVDEIFAGKYSPEFSFFQFLYEKGYIDLTDSKEEIKLVFTYNNSWIKILPSNENSRGSRATVTIYEECRLLKKGIIDSVFDKMAHPRQAVFRNLPQYKDKYGKPLKRWTEEAQSIYITSARFTSEWFWNSFKIVVNECFLNKNVKYNFFAGDIFLSILFGLKTKNDYYKAKNGSNEYDFRMEDLNEMLGEAEDAFFKREMFKKNQILKQAYKFPKIDDIINGNDLKNRIKIEKNKKNENDENNQFDEIRLLWIDFAFANTTGKEENDQSVIGCYSLIYDDKKNKFRRICDYITTHSASDSDGIDLKIREMYWDYKADYIVLDGRNGAEVIYNDLTKERKHNERPTKEQDSENGWNSHGFTVALESEYHVAQEGKLQDLKSRTIDPQAIPCIIPVYGTAELNSIMWLDLQKKLKDNEIDFLIDDMEFNEKFLESNDYFSMTAEEKKEVQFPYKMTMALVNEAVNLSQVWKEGKIKLEEPRSGTKDFIVALSYGNYIATLIENKLDKNNQKQEVNTDDWKFLSGDYSDFQDNYFY